MLLSGNERVLVIAPHADDEVLGCGGVIEKACRYNNAVKVVVTAVGNTKHPHKEDAVTGDIRKKELEEAMHFLGCKDFEVLYDDKDSMLDTIPIKELIGKLDKIIEAFSPSMIFIPLPSYHQDHQILYDACIAALRPNNNLYKLIAMYEYPLTFWNPKPFWNIGSLYLDISDTIDQKIEAFKKHKSQMRPSNHPIAPENVKKWAEMRGLEIGLEYAEKYYVLKSMII
ncbi:PIG-L family deacetylase [Bacillus luteolus]|uniref:PIG-L family deacetylase n=1 Tax=Litchfieldia luteola TaxID=682179 RepID=A0ABR9QFE8_9BACI|nr:PIG-L deacetylase family protein [Cytobacillus luteolus]MBE4907141.1 PIG-L family deacetylase [Cytobacillus luteolus]MBP1943389.1 LmbE family N-acetylglucosaminyl deacetylase [Cytobacillus luteolus]